MFIQTFRYDRQHYERFKHIISKWEPQSEVWSFQAANYALPGFGSVTALWAMSHLRRATNSASFGKIAMPAIPILGTVFCGLFHMMWVEYPMISGRITCTTCLELRSTVIQAFFGCVLPTVISGVTMVHYGREMYPFHDETFTKWSAFKANGRIIYDLFKKRRGDRILAAFFVANAVLGYATAYFQQEAVYTVGKRLYERGERFVVTADQWDPMRGMRY